MLISHSSIICMLISFLTTIGLFIGSYFVLRTKYSSIWKPFLLGSLTFLIFPMLLEQLFHLLVLRNTFFNSNLWIYTSYAACTAAVFEEFGRFISMKILKRNQNSMEIGLIYGLGYGTFEAFCITGITMLTNLILAVALNTGLLDIQKVPSYSYLFDTPPYMYLISLYERIISIIFQVGLSITMWFAVRMKKGKFVIYNVLTHFIFDFISVFLSKRVNITISELFSTFFIALFVFFSIKISKKIDY